MAPTRFLSQFFSSDLCISVHLRVYLMTASKALALSAHGDKNGGGRS